MVECIDDPNFGLLSIVGGVKHLSLVIILAGTNDVGALTSSLGKRRDDDIDDVIDDAKIIANRIIRLHDACRRDGGVRTLAVGVPGSAWQRTNARASRLRECVNDALRRFAEEEEEEEKEKGGGGGRETYYVDFPFPFARRGDDVVGDDDYSELWNPDGLHLSEMGYETLGRRLAPCVLDILEGI
jgi:lysophospholipase L1-like esterase